MRRREFVGAMTMLALCPWVSARAERKGLYRLRAPLTQPLQGIYPALFEGELIVCGGGVSLELQPASSNHSYIYSLREDSWRVGPALPSALSRPYLVNYQQKLLAIGGYHETEGSVRQVLSLDSLSARWQRYLELPEARAAFAAAAIDSRLIISGGRKLMVSNVDLLPRYVNAAETFVYYAGYWHAARPMPTPRSHCATVVLEGRMHVIGGRQQVFLKGEERLRNLVDHEVYDPESGRWYRLAPLPQTHADCAAAVYGGMIYLFGGEGVIAPRRVSKEVWQYDPSLNRWQSMPPMPVPRHALGAVSMVDGIHLVGGSEKAGSAKVSTRHSVYHPEGK
ncbi:Kelch repeat-containing protein [Sinobacterium caligoides]|nr:kelch repeat-containing protein [Sinobacterium caligoides]